MMFNRVIEYVFDKEFNVKQRAYSNYLGFSPKTTRNYLKNGIKKGRMLNQFILRLKNVRGSSKSNIAKFFSGELINAFEFISGDKGAADQILMSGAVDGYCFGVADACQEMSVEPTQYLNALPPAFYFMHFIDSVNLPFRTSVFDITSENFDSLSFPYNRLSKTDATQYFRIQGLTKRPHAKDAGPEVFQLLKESFSGVVASIALDTERLACSEFEADSNFLKSAWDEGNIVAQYFSWLRESTDCKTHDEFYKRLAESFPNINSDSVETNFKRWCKTGSLKNGQLLKLGEAMSNEHNGETLFFMQYLMAVILQFMKEVLDECAIEYPYESFKLDVRKWKEWIKVEYPLENWQPTKATSSVINL